MLALLSGTSGSITSAELLADPQISEMLPQPKDYSALMTGASLAPYPEIYNTLPADALMVHIASPAVYTNISDQIGELFVDSTGDMAQLL